MPKPYWPWAARTQRMIDRPNGGLRPVLHADFSENSFDMHFDGRFGDAKLPSDPLVGLPFCEARENGGLSVRQCSRQNAVTKVQFARRDLIACLAHFAALDGVRERRGFGCDRSMGS